MTNHPEWSPEDGPWCLKQWLPFNVPDPKIDTCLLILGHESDCRGIHGVFYDSRNGLIVGQLKTVSEEEATASRREAQEKKILKVVDLARELGAEVDLVSNEKDLILTATLPVDYLEHLDD